MNTTFRLVCAIVLIASFSAVSNAQQSSLFVGSSPNFTRIESGGAGTIILPSGGGTLLAAGSPIPSGTAWNGSIITPSYGGLGIDLSSASVGSLLYVPTTAGTWATLPAGASTYVLTSNGPNTAPTWKPAASGSSGGTVQSINTGTTLGGGVALVVLTGSAAFTVTLPAANSYPSGTMLTFEDFSTSASNAQTISAGTGDAIYPYFNPSGLGSIILAGDAYTGTSEEYDNVILISDGVHSWYVLGVN